VVRAGTANRADVGADPAAGEGAATRRSLRARRPLRLPPRPAVTLYDIVGELARTDTMRRNRRNAARNVNLAALTRPRRAHPPPSSLRPQNVPIPRRASATWSPALDVNIRERARALEGLTAELGRLTQKLVADVDRLDREAALWPQRIRLASEREAPADVQRGLEAMEPQLAALRKTLIDRRDQFLVAYERAIRMRSQVEALLARVAERRVGLKIDLRASRTSPAWEPDAVGFPLTRSARTRT
jgi:hypothetical protein